jgi:predicted nuclease of predicted toxin-antitoxin system
MLLADREQCIVITKDSDFLDRFLLFGKPNKLLLVETGNISNSALLEIFRKNLSTVLRLFENHRLIQIGTGGITAHE